MINLCVQSFGRETEYRRVILAVYSFYAKTAAEVSATRVVLFTDNPAYFEHYFQSLPVHYVLLTDARIRSMRGAIDFLHRMKIALIDEAFTITSGDLLYVDSDTFFITDPAPKLSALSPSCSFMHEREYSFDTLKDAELPAGATFQAFYRLLEARTFQLADGDLLRVLPTDYSWNAGVMFLHHSVSRLLPDVYTLTDQFYPDTANHASEQYAFSVVLQRQVTLQPCKDVVYHYWPRVEKKIVDLFLETQLGPTWAAKPFDEKVNDVYGWATHLPDYLATHVFMLRDNAIQAFNRSDYRTGFRNAWYAFLKRPFDFAFNRDVLYHLRRFLSRKK